jgi:hypothetical protein
VEWPFPHGKCVIFEYQATCLSHENGCVVLRNGLPLGQMGYSILALEIVVLPHRMAQPHLFIIDIFISLSWITFLKFTNNQITKIVK